MADISMSEVEKLMADTPSQDPHFVLGVMARIEQRRFRRELVRTAFLAAAAMLLLALVVPKLELAMVKVPALADLADSYKIAIAAVLMVATILLPRLSRG